MTAKAAWANGTKAGTQTAKKHNQRREISMRTPRIQAHAIDRNTPSDHVHPRGEIVPRRTGLSTCPGKKHAGCHRSRACLEQRYEVHPVLVFERRHGLAQLSEVLGVRGPEDAQLRRCLRGLDALPHRAEASPLPALALGTFPRQVGSVRGPGRLRPFRE